MWKWTLEDDNVWKWRQCLQCPYTECACHRPRFSAQSLESRDFMHETHFFLVLQQAIVLLNVVTPDNRVTDRKTQHKNI